MAVAPKIDRVPPKPRKIDYPTSDGKPMAETELHRDEMIDKINVLTIRYQDRNDVQVTGNNFLYYEEGNPKARVSPDVYVVFGVEKKVREYYKVWEEHGVAPAVVFEFTSRSTKQEDVKKKYELYERVLKVAEYILFDPKGDYLNPRLQGYRLRSGRYEPIPLSGGRPDMQYSGGRMYSEQLGLDLVIDGNRIRLWDPFAEKWLLGAQELARARDAEANRADAEANRADAEAKARAELEAELARVRAELEALQKNRGY